MACTGLAHPVNRDDVTVQSGDPAARQQRVAQAIRLARKRYGTMRRFSDDLRATMGWPTLSMAAVYAWESGVTKVPAVALVAAAELANVPLDQLLGSAEQGGQVLGGRIGGGSDALADQVGRLEDRVRVLERRRPV
jgi:hypothetical protein